MNRLRRLAILLLLVPLAASARAPRLTVARLQYDGGGDWYANPSSLPNLLRAIRERTTLSVETTEARVTLMDDRLWDYPFLHVTGHGNMKLSDAEVTRLREYLTRGGFLHVPQAFDAVARPQAKLQIDDVVRAIVVALDATVPHRSAG